jgi:hypothetical protein
MKKNKGGKVEKKVALKDLKARKEVKGSYTYRTNPNS